MISKDEPIELLSNNKHQLVEISTVLLSEFSKVLSNDNFNQLFSTDRSDYEKTVNHLIKEISSFRALITASSDNSMKDLILKKLRKTDNYLGNLLFNYNENAEWYSTNLASPALKLIKTTVEEIQKHLSELEDKEEEEFWMDFETTLDECIAGTIDTALMYGFQENHDVPLKAVLPSDEYLRDFKEISSPHDEIYPWLKTSIMAEIAGETIRDSDQMYLDEEADAKESEKESPGLELEVMQDLRPINILPIEIVDYIYRLGLKSCTSLDEGRTFISAFMLFGGHYRAVAADKQCARTGMQLLESLIFGSWTESQLAAAFEGDNATLLEVIMVSDGDIVNGAYRMGDERSYFRNLQETKLRDYLAMACEHGSKNCLNYLFSLDIGDKKLWKKLIDRSQKTTSSKPLLIKASENGHTNVVNLLLSKGAHANKPYISQGLVTTVLDMLKREAPRSSSHDGRFQTPLTEALIRGHFELATVIYHRISKRTKINTRTVMRELMISLVENLDVDLMKSALKEAAGLLNQPVDINFNYNNAPFMELIIEVAKQFIREKENIDDLIDIIEYLFEFVDAELDNRQEHSLIKFLGLEYVIKYLNMGLLLNNPRMMNIILSKMCQHDLSLIRISHPALLSHTFQLTIKNEINLKYLLGNLEAASCLLFSGVGFSSLHYQKLTDAAIASKNINLLTFLIMWNPYVLTLSPKRKDIIQIFLTEGNLHQHPPNVLIRLIEMGADLAKQVDMGWLFFQALQQNEFEVAKTIVTQGRLVFKSKQTLKEVVTLIAEREYSDFVLLLLKNTDRKKMIPLLAPLVNQFIVGAIKNNNMELLHTIFELLSEMPVKVILEKKQLFECMIQYNRLGMLHYLFNRLTGSGSLYYPPLNVVKLSILKAIEFHDIDLLAQIFKCCPGALPALKKDELSLLLSCDGKINPKIARLLLEHDFQFDKKTRQELPWLAVEANDSDLIRLLVQTKQNICSFHQDFNEEGETLYSRARKIGHTTLASLLNEYRDKEINHEQPKTSTNRYGFHKRKECDENKEQDEELYKNAKARLF